MNELCLVWPLEQLLCPRELTKLKAIKHRYHMWKDYSKRDNKWIAKWNAITREVCVREIRSKILVVK